MYHFMITMCLSRSPAVPAGFAPWRVRPHIDSSSAGADTGGVDRVDIHPPFFSKKKFEMSLYLK